MSSPSVDRLPDAARAVALAVARAAIPAGARFGEADERTVERTERLLAGFGRGTLARWGQLLRVFDGAARVWSRGRAFTSLPSPDAEALLARWAAEDADVARRTMALALTAPIKVAYYDDAAVYREFGSTWRFTAVAAETPRWMAQVTAGDTVETDVDLECDAVVVGTGAGGAVVACELARKGLAVLMLEEGGYHGRGDFDGRASRTSAASTAARARWAPSATPSSRCPWAGSSVDPPP
jgi:hypothetical protein